MNEIIIVVWKKKNSTEIKEWILCVDAVHFARELERLSKEDDHHAITVYNAVMISESMKVSSLVGGS